MGSTPRFELHVWLLLPSLSNPFILQAERIVERGEPLGEHSLPSLVSFSSLYPLTPSHQPPQSPQAERSIDIRRLCSLLQGLAQDRTIRNDLEPVFR